MKVLLIIIQQEGRQRGISLGIGYIASYLIKHKHEVKIYDPPPYERFDVTKIINSFKPDIVGISCMTATVNKAYNVAKKIKSISNIPIVFGGIHPTSMPEEVIKKDFIDYVAVGEGELTFKELADTLQNKKDLKKVDGLIFKRKGKIVINKPRKPIENLDDLPFPARHLFSKWYFMRSMIIRGLWMSGTNITASRGCPYNCTYCASKVMFGQRVRFRSVKKIVDEIEYLIKDCKLDSLWFCDDTFTINKKLVREVCEEIKKRKLKFSWCAQVRVDTVDEEIVKLLKEAGCVQFDIGVESGSEKVLKTIKKGITPEQTRKAFKIFRKYGIRTCATFMIGNPGETREDINKTVNLVREIKPDYVGFFITTPYPGTPMYKDLTKKGEMKDNTYEDYYHGGSREVKSLIKNTLPYSQLEKIRYKLTEEFYKGAINNLFVYPKFWLDNLILLFQRPSAFVNALKILWKTRRITEFYREMYYSHNFRKP